MFSRLRRPLWAASVLLTFTLTLSAIPIAPGTCVGQNNATCPGVLDNFNLTGDVLLASVTNPIAPLGGAFSGSITASVYQTSTGTLDFLYQYTADVSSISAIGRITMYDFANSAPSVGYVDGAFGSFADGSVIPQYVTRDADGSTIGFEFTSSNLSTKIDGGEISVILVIRTNATAYRPGQVSVINGGSQTVLAFAPIPGAGEENIPPQVIPEPGSFMLMGAGLIGTALFSRRLRRR